MWVLPDLYSGNSDFVSNYHKQGNLKYSHITGCLKLGLLKKIKVF